MACIETTVLLINEGTQIPRSVRGGRRQSLLIAVYCWLTGGFSR